MVQTNKQQCPLQQGIGQHYRETITANATSHTPISPGTTVGSSERNSDNKLEKTTVHYDRRNTRLDTSTKSSGVDITNAGQTDPHNAKKTSKNVESMPTLKNTTHNTPTPTVTTINSSEKVLENDREETHIRENRYEMPKPHLQPKELQSTITIDEWDQFSHQEITILENDDRVSVPSKIRITTQNPATITIISKRTNNSQQV